MIEVELLHSKKLNNRDTNDIFKSFRELIILLSLIQK